MPQAYLSCLLGVCSSQKLQTFLETNSAEATMRERSCRTSEVMFKIRGWHVEIQVKKMKSVFTRAFASWNNVTNAGGV